MPPTPDRATPLVRIHTGRIRTAGRILTLTTLLAATRAHAGPVDITAAAALEDVKTLASPALEGRGALTAGLVKAGDFIAGRFQAAGLTPGGDGATFFQAVDVPVPSAFTSASTLAVAAAGAAPRPLEMKRDWAPNATSASSAGVSDVVFAGYGITVPGKYDDYAGIDARGKTVLLLRYAPKYDAKAQQTADPAFKDGATLALKADNAIRHGAIAIAIVDPPAQGPDSVEPLAAQGGSRATAIASFHVSRATADALLAGAGKSVSSLQKEIDDGGKPASFAVPAAVVSFAVERLPRKPVHSRNVVAILEGADPALKNEAVLIGSHYDHLGMGDEGSTLDGKPGLHPGADDNASGTSAVLEIAKAFAAATPRPRRSVVFITFTGEEKGLIGSQWNAGHLPPKTIVAMINLDMVGRMKDDKLTVEGAQTSPDWKALVETANEEHLALVYSGQVGGDSDHASYLRRSIPALFFFTGLHPDYHRATDTWDKINADGLAKSARLAFRVARAAADHQERFAFVAPRWGNRMASGRAPSVRLGVMFDYVAEGVARIQGVVPGGAAAAAGLAGGDVIKVLAGKPVTDIDSYMAVMAGLKYGDTVSITVDRGGAPVTLQAKLTPPHDP